MQAIRHIGLPEVFTPETTDVYDRKNMPRVVFCLHALSLFLYKVGKMFFVEFPVTLAACAPCSVYAPAPDSGSVSAL